MRSGFYLQIILIDHLLLQDQEFITTTNNWQLSLKSSSLLTQDYVSSHDPMLQNQGFSKTRR